MRYTIRHSFPISPEAFWTKLFFDPEYNRALFEGHLQFMLYKVLTLDTLPDGSVHRRVECVPKVEMPAAAKKILGETASYVEDGTYDKETGRFTADVLPKVGGDTIKTKVTLWLEPRGANEVDRIAEVDTTVKIFGVGKVLESFIEKQTRASYDTAAEFTVRWIADKGL